jgi:hypothetical protein
VGVIGLRRSRFFVSGFAAAIVASVLVVVSPVSTGVAGAATAPRAAGYFKTLAPGAKLPGGKACAARIHRSKWEPRPENNAANHKVLKKEGLPNNTAFNAAWQRKYKPRITGQFQGTTDEIIQWASCKWGISDNLTRARADLESKWVQSTMGDYQSRGSGRCPPGWKTSRCPTSFGLMQSKWNYRPGTYPRTKVSTAFNVDSALAEMRGCLDGIMWFGSQSRGDVWGCVGIWFSGSFHNGDSHYVSTVRSILSAEPWRRWHG